MRNVRFARRLDYWLPSLDHDLFEVELASDGRHDVVADRAVVAQGEERSPFLLDHRRTEAGVLRGAQLVERAALV